MYREVSLIAHTRRTLRSANQSRGGRLHLGVRSKSLFSAFKSAKFLPSFYCFLSISSISLVRHRYSLPLFILSLFPSFLTKTPSRHFLESFDSRLMNRRWILFKKWKNLENCRIVREPSVHLEIKCRSPFQPVLSLSPVSVFIFAKREEVAPRSSLSLFALTRLHETRSFSAHSSPAWLFTPVAPLPPFPSLPNTFPPRPTPHPFRNKSQFSSSLSLSIRTNGSLFLTVRQPGANAKARERNASPPTRRSLPENGNNGPSFWYDSQKETERGGRWRDRGLEWRRLCPRIANHLSLLSRIVRDTIYFSYFWNVWRNHSGFSASRHVEISWIEQCVHVA